ncbi:hypothetical protein IWW50_000258 [Coemansia erecta]|nr:hypothetical protein GGF43_000381 [Coemansia sp. RSA 2618]KAJ2830472.1 hypothetical protein IWW50_000258 [Coemansia erecta]
MASNELDGEQFDVVVLGTGLEESIIASEAAASSKTVLHVDRNPYYGGSNACFSLSMFLEWAACHRIQRQTPFVEVLVGGQLTDAPSFVIRDVTAAGENDLDTLQRLAPFELSSECTDALEALLKNDRSYMLELVPKVVLCRGELIELLLGCGIGEYVQFKGVEHSYLARSNTPIERIPESKEDIFASTSLSLIEKRKLMRLMTLIGDDTQYEQLLRECGDSEFKQLLQDKFKLSGMLLDAVLYVVARVSGSETVCARDGCERVRRYVGSIGRFGRMAYLCGMYGGGSEISQSFSRLCAVSGGTYVLNEKVGVIEPVECGFSVPLEHGTVRAKKLFMSPEYAPGAMPTQNTISRAICVLDQACLGADTTALVSYVGDSGVVSLLYETQSTMAVPAGQSLLYAWIEGALAETKPLLIAAIQSTAAFKAAPLFTIFMETHALDASKAETSGIIVTRTMDATVDLDSTVVTAQQVVSAHFPSDT